MLLNQENIKMSLGGNMPSNMNFGIIGTGFIFRKHVQAIYKIGGKIVDVVDRTHGEDAWRQIPQNPEVDCVVILAPNKFHFEMTKFSAEKGKMVLCEKPLALNSQEARILTNYPNIFTVYQLRYHPFTKKLKSEIKATDNYEIEIDISVHRDEDYWKSWKGDFEKSGGILFNLGIHYFDLLLYLFDDPVKISTHSLTERKGEGEIKGKNYLCHWKIDAETPKEKQKRLFKINGINYDFSSTENLHVFVYQDLLQGKGVTPKEALKSIELIEKIYESYKK